MASRSSTTWGFAGQRLAPTVLVLLGAAACGSVEPSGTLGPDAARDGSTHPSDSRADATLGDSDASAHDAHQGSPDVVYDSSCGKDLADDPYNCGACGHDCLGGACEMGQCQPVVLVTVPRPGVSSFAIDNTSVFWTAQFTYTDSGLVIYDSGTVSKCPLTGCTSPTMLASHQSYPDAIWVAGPDLYWNDTNSSATMHCGTSCSDDATTFYAWRGIGFGGQGGPGLAINATSVFLADINGGILVCPRDACPTPTEFASQPAPFEVALSDAGVYWVNFGTLIGGKSPGYVDGSVNGCPQTGCPDATASLANHVPYGATGLLVQSGKAYWVADSLVSCDLAGCNDAPTALLTPPELGPQIASIAADAKNLYVGLGLGTDESEVSDAGWQLERCPLAGCADAATRLATLPLPGQGAYGGPIVVDATRVYFVSTDRTRILALAK